MSVCCVDVCAGVCWCVCANCCVCVCVWRGVYSDVCTCVCGEIQHLADRVLVLEAGKVKAFGPCVEVWMCSSVCVCVEQCVCVCVCRAASAVCDDVCLCVCVCVWTSVCGSTGSNVPHDTARIRIQASDFR